MNLRGVYTPGGTTSGSLHRSGFSDIRFANSIVGNLGAPLEFEEEEHRSLSSRPRGEGILVVNISDNPLMEYLPSASLGETLGATPEESEN